jgi:hypothetical protein
MSISSKIFLVAIWIIACQKLHAQARFYPFAPIYVASARYSEDFGNSLIASMNPAMIPTLQGFEAGIFAEKKYLSQDINLVLVSAGAFYNNNGGTVSLQHFGNTDYNETALSLGYGKKIGRIQTGILFQYINVNIGGTAKSSFLQTGIASVIKITDVVSSSIKILNPNLLIFTGSNEWRLASAFSLGFGWHASTDVYTGIETLKQEGRPLNIIFNLHYEFAERLYADLSWSTQSNQPFVSAGCKLNNINIEAGCSYHVNLGASPTIIIIYKKQNRSNS